MARGVSRKCGGEGGNRALVILGGGENHTEGGSGGVWKRGLWESWFERESCFEDIHNISAFTIGNSHTETWSGVGSVIRSNIGP